MRYTIVELAEIPREREKLKAVIGEARYEMRKSQLIRYAAYAIIIVAFLVLVFGACAAAPAPVADPWTIYLPFVQR